MTTIYNNILFRQRCVEYALIGFIFMQKHFSIYKGNSIKLKKYYIGNDDNEEYDCFHYYLELNNGIKKYIIDNSCIIYDYYEYKERFNPKQIKTLSMKEIKELLNIINGSNEFITFIKPHIINDYIIHLKEIQF
jgi:hypothetical protein